MNNNLWPVMMKNAVAIICATVIAVTFKNPWWVLIALLYITTIGHE